MGLRRGRRDRLIEVESHSDTLQGSWRRVEWQYDALGGRIRQTTWSWLVVGNLWVVTEDLRMVSGPLLFGWHLLELNATNNAPVRSYVWGLDLSDTLEGAGGVRGLLWVTLHTGSGPAAGTHFCAYDGNGDIVALSAASDGSATARYEYGPCGEPIRVSGPAAAINPFRFSTKRSCNTTDLVVYEYRAYSPALGRWLSRDLLGEGAALNLLGFLENEPLSGVDDVGLRRHEPRRTRAQPRDPRAPRRTPIPPTPPSTEPPFPPPDSWPGPDIEEWNAWLMRETKGLAYIECNRRRPAMRYSGPRSACGCCVVLVCWSVNVLDGRLTVKIRHGSVSSSPCALERWKDVFHGTLRTPCWKGWHPGTIYIPW